MKQLKRKNRILIIIALLLCLIGSLNILIWHFFSDNENNAIIVQEKSYLREYEIIKDEVHIYCVVSLYNQGDSTASVKLIGDFSQEVKGGLLADSELEAYFTDLSADHVTIESETSMDYVNIEFVGKYAGTSQMSSRNLPAIRVCNVEKSFGE
ncbi:MAG: hypothetical protein IJ661_00325 [Lachnospiraceae bacterium]|nr:hypothetical protein [Lachnospiraceae bacterium]